MPLDGRDSRTLTPHVQVLEDRNAALTLDDVRAQAAPWKSAGQDHSLSFGFSSSVYWLRVALVHPGAGRRELILDLGSPLQDHVKWHVVRGSLVEVNSTGDRLPFNGRAAMTRSLAMPLSIEAGERVEIYIRVGTHDGLFEPMRLEVTNRNHHETTAQRDTLLNGLYYGALLGLVLYNLFLFISTRERTFGLYVAYMFFYLTWSLAYRGFAFQYLWPEHPNFGNQMLTFSDLAAFVFLTMFTSAYLRLAERLPRWVTYLNRGIAVVALAALPIIVHQGYALAWLVLIPAVLAFIPFGISCGLWLSIKGFKEARFFVVAFAMLAAGTGLQLLDLVAVPWLTFAANYFWQVGSVAEALLLAFGLADAMNRLKAQSLDAERRAREAHEQAAVTLEAQVKERTASLELANARLDALSRTDELTGAFNRRHFDACLHRALLEHSQEGVLLCLFDIDHFKRFNDEYGHQAGDRALARVASAVRQRLRRQSDALFRVGGEEFAVLLQTRDAAVGYSIVQGLCDAVRGLGIPHCQNSPGCVSASFGALWIGPEVQGMTTPHQAYRDADALLYRAKELGRDRVETGQSPVSGGAYAERAAVLTG